MEKMHNQTDTSKAAYCAAKPVLPKVRERVFNSIRLAGQAGRTAAEIMGDLGINHQTMGSRLRELQNRNLIRDSGDRRPGDTGRKQIVWVAVEQQLAEPTTC